MTGTAQFTAGRLLLWTLYFATLAAIFSVLPATSLAVGVATFAAVVFAVVDIKSNEHFPGWLGVSYFACALSYAVAVGFAMMLLYPPAAAPKPPLPFWTALFDLVSGRWLRDVAQAIAALFALRAYYLMIIIACTLTSTAIALITPRRQPKSRSLLMMNAPGIVIFVWLISAIIYDKLIAA